MRTHHWIGILVLLAAAAWFAFGQEEPSPGDVRDGVPEPEAAPALEARGAVLPKKAPKKAPPAAVDPKELVARMLSEDARVQAQAFAEAQRLEKLPFDKALVRRLVGWLQEENRVLTWRAMSGLRKVGPPAAALLAPLLAHEDGRVRQRTLGVHRMWVRDGASHDVLPPLRPFLDDDHPGVREAAMYIIANGIEYDEAIAAWLLDEVRPADNLLYYTFESALAGMGGRGMAHLIAMLDDPKMIYNGLGGIRTAKPAALKAILPRLAPLIADERDENLQVATLKVLLFTLEGDVEALLPALRTALRGESYPVRTHALMVLEQMGERAAPAVPELVQLLTSGDARIVSRAAGVLGDVKASPDVVLPGLRAALGTDGGLAAGRALGAYGAAALPYLRDAFDEGDDDERYFALEGVKLLGRAAAPLAPRVIALIDDTDSELAVQAALTAPRLGPAADPGIPALLRRLHDDTLSPARAAQILMALGAPAEKALLQQLRGGHAGRRERILALLAHAPGRSGFALDDVAKHMQHDDAQVRFDAVRAVIVSLWADPSNTGISDRTDPKLRRRVRTILVKHGEDSDREIRQWIERALSVLNR